MNDLVSYVIAHTARGECNCGKCIDRGNKPDPVGHTVDTQMFKVAKVGEPTAEEFRKLTAAHRGAFNEVDPFDGKEHSYIELGGWIGDQGLALQYMALGALLGVWTLMTPKSMLPRMPEDLLNAMASQGLITIKSLPKKQDA